MAAAVQRKSMEAKRQRFTFQQTQRTVLMTFSTNLVQASERRSSGGSPRHMTVRISSMPSRIAPEALHGAPRFAIIHAVARFIWEKCHSKDKSVWNEILLLGPC